VVSPRGHALAGRVATTDISVVGPMARSAGDLEVALAAMAGPDPIDGAGWRLELPKPRHERLADFRVAVLLSVPHAEVDRAVQDGIQSVADTLAKAGAKVSDSARPALDTLEVDRLFRRLLMAAMSGRLPEDAFRANLEKVAALDPSDMSGAAQSLRAATLYHRDWLVGNEARHRMRLAWAEFFRDWDVLLCPPVTTTAFPHNHEGDPFTRSLTINGKARPMGEQLFWAGYAGLFYLPATVAPATLSPAGLPSGVQIIGPQYGDYTCLRLARLLEREHRAFVPPPGFSES
jgi:amidase